MKEGGEADDLMQGLQEEIDRLEKLRHVAAMEEKPAGPANPDRETVSCIHVKDGGSLNPSFLKGIEFARLTVEYKLEALLPSQFLFLAEVEKDGVIANRDNRRKCELSPGENISSRIVAGLERYQAKVRGRVIAIGDQFHILPSDVDGKMVSRKDATNLSAYLDVYPAFGSGRVTDLAAVREFLEKNNIRYGIREGAILEALESCGKTRKPVKDVLVSKGFPPVDGKPGSIEYLFDRNFQGPLHLDLNNEGKVDFRNVKWIPVVTQDQLLARITSAVPGTDGVDVTGRSLPPKPIPKSYLVPGRNVRTEKEETEFYSEINGCVQLNGSLLDVMNVFVVNSDVDYHTGNITFEGNIMITGSVRKGFEVAADGDILVLENVEPCKVKAGRDIHVKGGALGAGKGQFRLEAGRDISVGYSENAWLEAHGDIVVENFSLQSFLYCSGRILLEKKKGSLLGGEAIAAKGVEAKSFGSSSGIKTHVATGVDYALKRQQASLARQASELNEAMAKIDRFLRSLLELSSRGALHPSKAQALKEIVEKRRQISKAHAAITTRSQELEYQQENLEPGRIKAIEIVHPEVFISIRGRTVKVVESHYRSLFRLDEKTDQIIRGPA